MPDGKSLLSFAALILDYGRMLTFCPLACGFHSQLIYNLRGSCGGRICCWSADWSMSADGLPGRSFWPTFRIRRVSIRAPEFDIPLNRQELADFPCVSYRNCKSSERENAGRGHLGVSQGAFCDAGGSSLGKSGLQTFHCLLQTLSLRSDVDPNASISLIAIVGSVIWSNPASIIRCIQFFLG